MFRKLGIKPFTKEFVDIIVGEYESGLKPTVIAKRHGICYQSVSNHANYRGVIRNSSDAHKKYSLDEHLFKSVDTEDKAYWLGFLIGDGSVNDHGDLTVALKSSDIAHLHKLLKFLKSNNFPKFYTTNGGKKKGLKNNAVYVCFRSHKLVRDLSKYGIVPRKSLIANPNLKLIPQKLHYHFWRGVLDADGWVCTSRRKLRRGRNHDGKIYFRIDFHTGLCGSYQIVKKFKNFVNKQLDMQKNMRKTVNIFQIHFSADACMRVLDCLYKDSIIFLERKFNCYKLMKERPKYA